MTREDFLGKEVLSKRLLSNVSDPQATLVFTLFLHFPGKPSSISLAFALILASELDGEQFEGRHLIYSSPDSSKPHVTEKFNIY